MASALVTAAALALAAASGQLSQGEGAPAGEPQFAIPPPPTVPMAGCRVVTADGREHRGRIAAEIEGGIEFENQLGARYALPLRLIRQIEPGGTPAAGPRRLQRTEPRLIERQLGLLFDLRALEERRSGIHFGDKAALLALGALTAVLGVTAFEGKPRVALGALGIAEAFGGAAWLTAAWVEDSGLARRIAERQAALDEAAWR